MDIFGDKFIFKFAFVLVCIAAVLGCIYAIISQQYYICFIIAAAVALLWPSKMIAISIYDGLSGKHPNNDKSLMGYLFVSEFFFLFWFVAWLLLLLLTAFFMGQIYQTFFYEG